MKTVEYLNKIYVVEGTIGAPAGAVFLDSLPSDKLVTLRNILTEGLDLGRAIKMFQSKAKGIKLVTDLLLKWDATEFEDVPEAESAALNAEFNDDLPKEMQPALEAEVEPAPTGDADELAAKKWEVPQGSKEVRAGSKQAALVDLLKRPEGASIKDIIADLNWVSHTARGAISRDVKKRLGYTVTTSKVEGRGRVYRIES